MKLFLFLVFTPAGIASLIGLYYWKSLSSAYRFVLSQTICAFTFESIGTYLTFVAHIPNAFIYNIYLLLELLFLSVGGAHFISRLYRKYVYAGLGVVTVFWIFNVIVGSFFELFNWLFVGSSILLVVLYSIVLFQQVVFKKIKIKLQPVFYLCLSVIFYFTSVVPLFGLINYLMKSNMLYANKLYYINLSLAVLRYALVAIAFYLYGSQARRGYVRQ